MDDKKDQSSDTALGVTATDGAEAGDDHAADGALGALPGLTPTKLRVDDPRLAIPQPQLTRWRRSYVFAGVSVLTFLLVGGVVFAAAQRQKRSRRGDEHLELYSQHGGSVPDAISRLNSVQTPGAATALERPVSPESPVQAPEAVAVAGGADAEYPDEAYAGSDTGPQARSTAPESISAAKAPFVEEGLPPMFWKAAKGIRGDAVAQSAQGDSRSQAPHFELPAGLGSSQALMAEQSAQRAAAMDDDDRKEAFLANGGALPDLDAPLHDRSLCELDAGDLIQADLETAINTDLPAQGTLKARVTKNVLCGPNHEYVAIPQGATLSGSADSRVAYGQNRVLFCWHSLYLPPSARHPHGATKQIRCVPGAEITGEIGLPGDVDNHWDSLIGGIAISTFMSLGTSASAGSQTGFAPNMGQQLARGAGQSISSAGDRIAQRELMRKPTVYQPRTSFALVLNAVMTLEPWEAR